MKQNRPERPLPPFPQRFQTQKQDKQFRRFLDVLKQLHINIPLVEAFEQMPNYVKFMKDILSKKRRLGEFETVALAKECSAILKNKLPPKLKVKLGIGEARPTTVTLQLADRSYAHPEGKIEDVLVRVDKCIFSTDFIVLDYEADNEVPIILGRPFLAAVRTLIDVQKGELTMRVHDPQVTFNVFKAMRFADEVEECSAINVLDSLVEAEFEKICSEKLIQEDDLADFEAEEDNNDSQVSWMEGRHTSTRSRGQVESLELSERTFKQHKPSVEEPPVLELKPLPAHLRYAYLGDSDTLPVIIAFGLSDIQEMQLLEVLRKFKKAIGWTIADIKGISPSICMHKIYLISDSQWVSLVQCVPKKGGVTVVPNDANELIPTRTIKGWRVCMGYRKLNKATRKDHFPLPFIDQMLDRLAGREYYCFLDGYSGYNQIAIALEDQEKTTFTCPYGTFAFRRMPFGLCNAPATFQRSMMAIFSNMVEQFLEVFMDDFSVVGDSFHNCFKNLEGVLKRCEETSLVLNWEKCHFMMTEGIILGHRISKQGIEVDKAKIEIIDRLPSPTSIRGIRSFLGHVGFYRRFIKDFSKISKPLCSLLEQNTPFNLDADCLQAFMELKKRLTTAPIIVAPDWSLPFELMCDASDFAVGAVLGQRKDKNFHSIYYASRTLTEAHLNYTTTEKELLAVVFAFDKFRAYLVGTKVVVYTDHSAIKYLIAKKDAKPRLIKWILLLREFDLEIRDRKGTTNQVADYLARLEERVPQRDKKAIKETFPDEQLFRINQLDAPWYADVVNYLQCAGQILRRCVPEEEMESILHQCHSSPYGGHYGGIRTTSKILQSGFYWPTIFKDAHAYALQYDRYQWTRNISRRHEMPLNNIMELDCLMCGP
ncbi:LOW QUALITY PROTEIN: uncharacterized protein LOC112093618 [Morus notabilis]|uniref:LOW QUALITY PROTEIN: uncharacterized protein LOC112093618 n=1 Tax=Morus notabilis TaxID=981085 RepID=UPI000CED3135|nr:LOW QUALITY PROTEIN: uncharacterized protein LOC112093618 [Morus notabilis]